MGDGPHAVQAERDPAAETETNAAKADAKEPLERIGFFGDPEGS